MGGPSTSPTSTMVDWSDSHYKYVKTRIQVINPARVFSGIFDAVDWPPKELVPETYYFILGGLDSNRGQGPGTNPWSAPIYGLEVSWAWSVIGTDIPSNELMANRSDRYRKNFQMIQEILQGIYPGFCEMFQYSPNPTGGPAIGTPYTPAEYILQKKPRFSTRIERSTGILFGSASLTITGLSPQILS